MLRLAPPDYFYYHFFIDLDKNKDPAQEAQTYETALESVREIQTI